MSARKNVLPPYKIISAGDMGGSLTSLVTEITYLDNVCISAVWSAGSTPSGTIFIQGSNDYARDYSGNVTNAGTWTSLTLSPTPSVSGNSGSILLDLNQLSFPYLRVLYTRLGGSGTLNVVISGKQV